ncbi:MAG: hypothetical protein IPK16_02840 [Anaerolineales bacterium]|nr:hypothetical protein [Anaerolineales bacterium]
MGWKYQEFRDRTIAYAAAVKAADPSAELAGPVVMGWTYYWYGAYDGQREDWATPDDRLANGDTPFAPWYLRELKRYEETHGTRLLDYFDLHYYPQAPGVSLSPAGGATTQALRLRSTRSLWDPTYVDESWIADAGPDGGIVRLLPRMKEWVAKNYPGTKLAITEYNWGALDHINGALAQAEVLGIFGREGLDLATLWAPPTSTQPGAFAYRMFRNYDGHGGRFGETSVHAHSADAAQLGAFAAQRQDGALTLMLINKSTEAITATVNLAGFSATASATVHRYSSADLNTIEDTGQVAISGNTLQVPCPAESITLAAIPRKTVTVRNWLYIPSAQR